MGVNTAACWMLVIVSIASVTGKPVSSSRTHKRQSDQRVAELETLLALQKYGAHHHFLRAQSADGGGGSFSSAYGIIDFNKIGRKKKSSPQTPPEVNDWDMSSLASSRRSSSNPSNEVVSRFRSRNNWRPPSLNSAASDDTDNLENDMRN